MCNICDWKGSSFYPVVLNNQLIKNRVCPKCFSQPKDRSLKWFLDKQGLQHGSGNILDIAPSRCLFHYFSKLKNINYQAIDLYPDTKGITKMDITKLQFPDKMFKYILCFNVLEHIKNDMAALKEIMRTLSDDGFIYLSVPIDKNLLITKEYTQPDKQDSDHVRKYGVDFEDRVNNVGLKIESKNWETYFTPSEKVKYGLLKGDFFIIKKNI